MESSSEAEPSVAQGQLALYWNRREKGGFKLDGKKCRNFQVVIVHSLHFLSKGEVFCLGRGEAAWGSSEK